jgi:hypothetical protein
VWWTVASSRVGRVGGEVLKGVERQGEARAGILAGPLYGLSGIVDGRLRRLVDPPRASCAAEQNTVEYLVLSGSGCFSFLLVWSRACANDGVERVVDHAPRAAVEALDVGEVARLLKVALDESHTTPIG